MEGSNADDVISSRIERLQSNQNTPFEKTFTIDHLKAIHQHLFEGIEEWAGEFRTRPATLQNFDGSSWSFTPPENIEQSLHAILPPNRQVKGEMRKSDPEIAAKHFAKIFGEINLAHPFPDGNGRTQREFIRELTEEHGWKLDVKNLNGWKNSMRLQNASELYCQDKSRGLEALQIIFSENLTRLSLHQSEDRAAPERGTWRQGNASLLRDDEDNEWSLC